MQPPAQDHSTYFEQLYARSDDPYGVHQRWYEARKRALLLASLLRPRYGRAYEPGCGAAGLSEALAPRCAHLLASDFCPSAVSAARARLAHLPQVQVALHTLPQQWPHAQGPFDLIVLSEIGYFMSPAAWQQVAQACAASLSDDGELVACDWRHDFAQRTQSTPQVHATLGALGLHRHVLHEEADFVLQLWSRDARSSAQREGIRAA
ncbi:class I SAM-dependent methyltransferase [Xenophilus arseniciresistens]|uniref:Class I SAM-dependent methyltransferase n=1 Tax=Xenophilus arseniciresistens TaxID=1283306 RepID=A0AAE3N5M0_9BURK|nr:class I SAM-dependent methyltransferase [Xenophilus arseniciresistens]MDA7415033.1 class I SAM-dependent methyltransferase [Xenophilus arseniciresistens]